ncbi:hypothetical protein [Natrinema ejinorense]|uniref:hypothetical protein n=1 Tax=Natrinema ejinorense TaxID=373386 RepID=UPI00117FD3FD|nr:hypothetical protein [Natrinema ejinorense]
MVSVDVPTAVIAVLISVILGPFVNLLVEEVQTWRERQRENEDAVQQWREKAIELAKDAALTWETQYENQDVSTHEAQREWGQTVHSNLRTTKTKMHNRIRASPPDLDDDTEGKLIELLTHCQRVENTSWSTDEFQQHGEDMKQCAEDVVDTLRTA